VESFPPARIVSGLISRDLERGFLLFNGRLVAFGIWSFFWPVRRGWPSVIGLAWIWVAIERVNGVLAIYLARRLLGSPTST
jgi:hypothetical protein